MTLKLYLLLKPTHQTLLEEKSSGELRLWHECGGMTSNIISLVALSLHILNIRPCIMSQNVSL